MLAQPSWTMYKRLCWWPYKNLKITWAWIWLVGNCHRGLTLGWRRGNHAVRHDALKPEACFWRPYYFRFDGSARKVVHSSMHTRHLKRACLRPFTWRKPISYTTLAAGTRRILASRVTVRVESRPLTLWRPAHDMPCWPRRCTRHPHKVRVHLILEIITNDSCHLPCTFHASKCVLEFIILISKTTCVFRSLRNLLHLFMQF